MSFPTIAMDRLVQSTGRPKALSQAFFTGAFVRFPHMILAPDNVFGRFSTIAVSFPNIPTTITFVLLDTSVGWLFSIRQRRLPIPTPLRPEKLLLRADRNHEHSVSPP